MIDIHIQEMYKYSLVLALDSLKDLEANFNSREVKMFKCPLQHPPVHCAVSTPPFTAFRSRSYNYNLSLFLR